ncbi:hypothetical protein [Neobacillus sp. LXY-4]|uniref:hypothetical protein n=1 Tax=Neobacillus sp. LXY-4 TaxID=3379826 RepID=UPI003EE149CE
MENETATRKIRRYNNFTSVLNSNYIHLRNPWVTAWWSAAFPGFGHIRLGIYVKGLILLIWEIIINVHSRLNEAMVFSFNGQFELAKDVLNIKMLFLYIPIYIHCIWDSYRQTVDLNKHYLLAENERAPIVPFIMNGYALNYLDKRNPWNALVWSLLFPGLGNLYVHRVPTGFFIVSITTVIIYLSNFFEAVQFTLMGSFNKAGAILDPEWALFLPSIYCFSAFEAYVLSVEYNKLYKKEQSQYLEKNYQKSNLQLFESKEE